ncbi:MAG: hypothetical protein U9P61_02520 [Patescibacteria group bacterium]|nr:hypothetical protein [Patescibacteria group bacterium]
MSQINSQERRIETIKKSVNHLFSFIGEDKKQEEVRETGYIF